MANQPNDKLDDKYVLDENGHKYRRYDFIKTKPIPVYDQRHPDVQKLIRNQQPVIIKNLNLVEPALKWSLEYLKHNIGTDKKNVYISPDHKFIYYNKSKCMFTKNFVAPNRQEEITFSEFADRLKSWQRDDERVYYQQALTDTASRQMTHDFKSFNWSWLSEQQAKQDWSDLSSNVLFIGQPGNVTPVHYDEQQNFFAQTKGYKRMLLFHPKYIQSFYPYPFHHPCDRQSQVDFEKPDFDRFPKLRDACGFEGIVGPGDVLYIPIFWWHYVETTLDSEYSVSLNFWYKNKSDDVAKLKYPLEWYNKISIMRNIENMLGVTLGDPNEVGAMLQIMANGRFKDAGFVD